MAKEWERNISDQTSVELEISLPDLFPGQLIPDSGRLREAIGQEVIDIIRNRTQDDEKSWNGKPFKDYSDEYAHSVEFKAYGKKKDDPNLTQTGDMLGLMTVLDAGPASIKIGWNDTLQSEKAHGHITGHVGVKRDFFGLSGGDIERLRKKFASELDTSPDLSTTDTSANTQSFLEGRSSIGKQSIGQIINNFFGQNEES